MAPVLPTPAGIWRNSEFGQRFLHRQNVGDFQPGQHGAHAAGNIEADAAGRHHAARVGVEGGDAADRKAVAPMGVRHDVGGMHNAG